MVVTQVLAQESGAGGLTVPTGTFAEQLGRGLVTSGYFAARGGDVPEDATPRNVEVFLELSYDWAPDAAPRAGSLVLAAEARVEFVQGRGELAPRAAMVFEVEVKAPSAESGQVALSKLGSSAMEKLAESLALRERLRRASHAELLSALAVDLREPSMRVWGLSIAADRGLLEAADAAAEAMASSDEKVRAAALAALVEFRLPGTVPVITDALDFADYEELRVAIEALNVIGGEDAEAFLEFVASGHSDAGMRQRAKEALGRMRGAQAREPDKP